ncbi:MAG: hypothetical protein ACI8Y8_000827 [Planctomycetota bacterium]|jgi:hypothetical protein
MPVVDDILAGVIAAIALAGGGAFLYLRGGRIGMAWRNAADQLGLTYGEKGRCGPRSLRGQLGECEVFVDTDVDRHVEEITSSTCYELRYPKTGFEFRLQHSRGFRRVAGLFDSRRVAMGVNEFDRSVIVKALGVRNIRAYLPPRRQAAVAELMRVCPGAVVENGRVSWRAGNETTSTARLETVLGHMTSFVVRMG